MGILTLISVVKCGLYALYILTNIPILRGEEQPQCPSLKENPICPCYNFKEGLFLECPSATPNGVKNVLTKIRGTVQSLSIYGLDNLITELRPDFLPPHARIIRLQISQTNINEISPNALTTLRDSLRSLSILSSKLNMIPKDSFSQLHNIEEIDLQHNNIKEIQANQFPGLKLNKINLKGNEIENILESAFHYQAETLVELDLTRNFLTVFPLKPLANLTKLSILRLASNQIQSIPHSLNISIVKLVSVDLSSNVFTRIERNWFQSMPHLKTLTLFSNHIEQIDEESFFFLKNLEEIDLSRNKLRGISSHIFKKNVNIRSIDLSHNHLHYVTGLFSNLTHLTEIFLSENNIIEISDDVFYNTISLAVLNLEYNAIQSLEPNCFSSLHNLTQLHIGTNFLKKLPVKIFQANTKLITLSLDNNRISELSDKIFDKLEELKELRLQYNKLTYIKRNVFSPLPGLLELHLQNNAIQSIESHAFITLKNLQHIDLQDNQLTTIGDVFPNRNSTLVSIQLSSNRLSLLKNSSLRGQANVQIMWLTRNNLNIITFNLLNELSNIQRLYIKNNSIVRIEDRAFMNLKKIKYLDLSSNKLTRLGNETFYKVVTLEELYLQKNNINHIEKDTFKHLLRLKMLNLSENKLITLDFNLSAVPVKQLNLNLNSISIIESSSLKSLPNLNDLHLNQNLLTWDDITQIQTPGLKSLTLSSNNFTLLENNTFCHLLSLQSLTLQMSNISQLLPAVFTKNQNLLRINLAYNNLKDLHKDIFAFTTILQELNLKGNSFTDFPHVALFNVTSLESLNLCDNQLHSIDFFRFTGLRNLKTLSLCDNRISILYGFNSPSLKNLLSLNLSNNMLTVLPPNFFQYSLMLKEVDLSHNFFKHIPSNGLSEAVLPALTTLNISSNSLEQLLLSYPVKQFPLLEELIITKTNLSIITSKDFEYFPSLKKLMLKTNCINRLSPGAFLKLHYLEWLDMSENKLEHVPRERLQGLYSVRLLNISRNILRELEEFTGDLQSLQKFDLSFNHITRISKNIFQNLQSLTELYLSGNWLSFIATDTFIMLHNIVHIDLSKNYFEVINTKLLESIEAQVKTIAYDENPLTCNCDAQELWRWMQNHYKSIYKGSSNLRCEYPEDLHGYSFIELTSQKLCDVPVVIRIAIQDIQTYSVMVSWQSRNQSGLSGYQVAYYKEHMPEMIRGKILNATARMTRLNHLTPGTKYTICVIAMGNFRTSAGSSLPDARIAASYENTSVQLYGDEHLLNHLRSYMNDSQTSKCTSVNTIELFGTSLESPFSNTYMGIAEILTRRLSLVVGCCIGFIVFIVLVSALGYMKTKKRPVVAKVEVPVPQYISYDNFPVPNIEAETTDMDINTISDTKQQFKSCE